MAHTYDLGAAPVAVDLGRAGRTAVRASVPFLIGTVQHCADYLHSIDVDHRRRAFFQALDDTRPGRLTVWRRT
jgi:hypothetical protein